MKVEGRVWLKSKVNQIGIIRVVSDSGERLVFIGQTAEGNSENQDVQHVLSTGAQLELVDAEIVVQHLSK